MKENKKEVMSKFHRTNIMNAAEMLFFEKGIESTTVDDIAKAADYSKATLYVYFKNKEEIISTITLNGMKMLKEIITQSLTVSENYKDKYYTVCFAIADFQQQYPLYFESTLKEINVDIELDSTPQVYREIYDIGEDINREFYTMFQTGMEQGYMRSDLHVPKTVFLFWASISGIIRIANQKEKYLQKSIGVTKQDFLQYSFDTLLKSIVIQ